MKDATIAIDGTASQSSAALQRMGVPADEVGDRFLPAAPQQQQAEQQQRQALLQAVVHKLLTTLTYVPNATPTSARGQ